VRDLFVHSAPQTSISVSKFEISIGAFRISRSCFCHFSLFFLNLQKRTFINDVMKFWGGGSTTFWHCDLKGEMIFVVAEAEAYTGGELKVTIMLPRAFVSWCGIAYFILCYLILLFVHRFKSRTRKGIKNIYCKCLLVLLQPLSFKD
jgi:hypothetical protein